MASIKHLSASCLLAWAALSLAGCDARVDPNTGSGSAASAPAAAASRQQLDPH